MDPVLTMAQAYENSLYHILPLFSYYLLWPGQRQRKTLKIFFCLCLGHFVLLRRYCYTDIMIFIMQIAILTVLPGIF